MTDTTPPLSLLVTGSGWQALLAAFALKRLNLAGEVRLLQTPAEPAADVSGEAITHFFTSYLSKVLGVPNEDIYAIGQPIWSLGTKFIWGRQKSFYRSYDAMYGSRLPGYEVDPGYLAVAKGPGDATLGSALMNAGRLFPGGADQAYEPFVGLNFLPENLEALLTRACHASGVEMLEGGISHIQRGPQGIASLHLDDGRNLGADLFIDVSGQLRDPDAAFLSYDDGFLCTRALTLRRTRGSDPLRVHGTTRETDSGFIWRLEHEGFLGMGFAWNPARVKDGFNPQKEFIHKSWSLLEGPVHHEWQPGRLTDAWQGNVLAVGDAAGFLDPLVSSHSSYLILQLEWLRKVMPEADGVLPGLAARKLYNTAMARAWDEMRDFTALHYRFRTSSLGAPEPDLGGHQELVDLYRSIGPSIQLTAALPYAPGVVSLDAWLAALIGLGVPFPAREIPAFSQELWRERIATHQEAARRGLTLDSCLAALRKAHPAPQAPAPVSR